MADFVFNIAKGRVAELYNRVESNDPANSALIVVAVVSTETDDTMGDVDTLAALLALTNCAEATNTNYARKTLTDAELAAFPSPDDTNNRMEVDIPDQTWSAVASGDNWTHLIICYDDDTGSGTDTNVIPLTSHDFAITTDGSDVTAQVNASGFFRAA